MLFDKKILVLVLSYNEPPYSDLMHAQQQTWYREPESNVETMFYYGSLPKNYPGNMMVFPNGGLQFDTTDNYYMMHWKFKLALDAVWDMEWDLIFRTNSSSYVHKDRLKKYCATLPLEKIYGGWTMCDSNFDGGYCVSGAGIFLSRDYADVLRKELKNQPECEEDVLIGRILRPHGARPFDDQSRVEYSPHPGFFTDGYHVRFKTRDRVRDAQNMITYHEKFLQ